MKKLTVIICTYNRSDLLQECLESIVNQSMDDRNFDVVVVDNNSSDRTKEVVDSMAGKYHNVHYLKEENQGLSHARNAGWRLAKTEWVNYLDDDAISHNDYVEKILETIQQYDYPIFGGVYHQWFKFGRPDWFPETEGTNKYLLSKTGVLSENKFASGGNITFKREILESLNGFNTSLGMSGDKVSYGEEIELQIRARAVGIQVGFNPDIEIDHLIRKDKLKLDWWLDSYYAKGVDAAETFRKKNRTWLNLAKGIGFATAMAPVFFIKLLFASSFKKGTFVLKLYGPLYYLAGKSGFRKPKWYTSE